MNYEVNQEIENMNLESNYVIGEDGGFVNGKKGYISPRIVEILNQEINDINVKRIYCICSYLDVLGREIIIEEVCKLAGVEYTATPFGSITNSEAKLVEQYLIELNRKGFMIVKGETENKLAKAKEIRTIQGLEFSLIRLDEILSNVSNKIPIDNHPFKKLK